MKQLFVDLCGRGSAVFLKMSSRRSIVERNERCKKRESKNSNFNGYAKRKMTGEKVCHYILFPVVTSTIGKSSDFYFHILSLCWNDKNLLHDSRFQKLLLGLHLNQEVDISDLDQSTETGWFIGSNARDLAKIGKIAGYFLRSHACSVGSALDENFDPDAYVPIPNADFNECVNSLKENKAITPVVVKLEISPESCFDASKFICLNEELVRGFVSGNEVSGSRRAKLLQIKPGLHGWAWDLLNTKTLEQRLKLVNDGIFPVVPSSDKNKYEIPTGPSCLGNHNLRISVRAKRPNPKYSYSF